MTTFNSKKFLIIVFGLLLFTPNLFANSLEERRMEKMLAQAMSVFPSYDFPPTIEPVTCGDRIRGFFSSLFNLQPTSGDITRAQLRAIGVMKELGNPEAFEVLMRASRFGDGIVGSKHSSVVQWAAREALFEIMPQLSPDQRIQYRDALGNQRERLYNFHLLPNDTLGPSGQDAINRMDHLINLVEETLADLAGVPATTSSTSCWLLNYEEAGEGLLLFPTEFLRGAARIATEEPLKAPTRIIGGLFISGKAAVVDFIPNVGGLFTAGAYGNSGHHLGESIANEVVWAVPAIKFGRRVPGYWKDGATYFRTGFTPGRIDQLIMFKHDFFAQVYPMRTFAPFIREKFLGTEHANLTTKLFETTENLMTRFEGYDKACAELRRQGDYRGAQRLLCEMGDELGPELEQLNSMVTNTKEAIAVPEFVSILEQEESMLRNAIDLLSEFKGNEVSGGVIRSLETELRTFQKNYETRERESVRMNLALSDSPYNVQLESLAFRRVLFNLVKNAEEAGADQITIRTILKHDHVLLIVEDNGSGMTPEVLRQAFDMDFSTKNRGSGQGLASVKNSVESMKGTIKVASEPNVGTTFTMSFPIRQ